MGKEKNLDIKSQVSVTGISSSLTDSSGQLKINIQHSKEKINVGNDLEFLKDSDFTGLEILEERKSRNSKLGIECELLTDINPDVILEIDIDGNLYISNEDSQDYIINNNAELIFNKNQY